MLPSLATIEQLSQRIPIDNEELAQARLDSASALIRAYAGKDFLDEDGNVDAPDIIITICLDAAERAMLNPNGYSYEQIGHYAVRRSSTSSTVYLTDEEIKLIRGIVGRAISSIKMTIPELQPFNSTVYVPTIPDSGPFPIGE